MKGRIAALVLVFILALSGCVRTGVRDYAGWQKAVESGQPCAELFDIRGNLPASVDRRAVDADLRRIGCETAESRRSDDKGRDR
jgi:hypothetical protein